MIVMATQYRKSGTSVAVLGCVLYSLVRIIRRFGRVLCRLLCRFGRVICRLGLVVYGRR